MLCIHTCAVYICRVYICVYIHMCKYTYHLNIHIYIYRTCIYLYIYPMQLRSTSLFFLQMNTPGIKMPHTYLSHVHDVCICIDVHIYIHICITSFNTYRYIICMHEYMMHLWSIFLFSGLMLQASWIYIYIYSQDVLQKRKYIAEAPYYNILICIYVYVYGQGNLKENVQPKWPTTKEDMYRVAKTNRIP